jgi:predicted NAD/FAD-binding protein
MIFDILRFNLFALDILKEEGKDELSIGEYLDREGYGDGFKEDYLLVGLLGERRRGRCADK